MLRRGGLLKAGSLKVAESGGIATLTFCSPATRNAMTVELGDEFKSAVANLKENAVTRKLRAVIVTGEGGTFSAGGDVGFLQARIADSAQGNVDAMMAFYHRFLCVRQLPVPVIAAVNGHAIGAGLCLALGCDIRVIADSAKLAVNFTRLGIHPGMGATYTLPKIIGHGRASRMLLAGNQISAQEAFAMGMCSAVCPAEDVVKEAARIAEELSSASNIAVRETLITCRGDPADLQGALLREAKAQALCYAEGRDLQEALNALREKRTPKFVA